MYWVIAPQPKLYIMCTEKYIAKSSGYATNSSRLPYLYIATWKRERERDFFSNDDDGNNGSSGRSSSKHQQHSSESANTNLAREKPVKVNVQEKLFPLLFLFWLLWLHWDCAATRLEQGKSRAFEMFVSSTQHMFPIYCEWTSAVSLTLCAATFDSLIQKNVAKRKWESNKRAKKIHTRRMTDPNRNFASANTVGYQSGYTAQKNTERKKNQSMPTKSFRKPLALYLIDTSIFINRSTWKWKLECNPQQRRQNVISFLCFPNAFANQQMNMNK